MLTRSRDATRVIAGVVFLAAAVLGCGPSTSVRDATDARLIDVARSTAEGQAFLARYPGAMLSVDRSGRTAVDFRESAGVRLRVFIEDGPRSGGSFLECPGVQIVERDVADAVRRGCSPRP